MMTCYRTSGVEDVVTHWAERIAAQCMLLS